MLNKSIMMSSAPALSLEPSLVKPVFLRVRLWGCRLTWGEVTLLCLRVAGPAECHDDILTSISNEWHGQLWQRCLHKILMHCRRCRLWHFRPNWKAWTTSPQVPGLDECKIKPHISCRQVQNKTSCISGSKSPTQWQKRRPLTCEQGFC